MTAIRSVKSVTATTFEIVPEGELSTVIDATTGRPVAAPQFRALAELECADLNAAAASGPKALARALGAIEE
jgi:hypothetical protein